MSIIQLITKTIHCNMQGSGSNSEHLTYFFLSTVIKPLKKIYNIVSLVFNNMSHVKRNMWCRASPINTRYKILKSSQRNHKIYKANTRSSQRNHSAPNSWK